MRLNVDYLKDLVPVSLLGRQPTREAFMKSATDPAADRPIVSLPRRGRIRTNMRGWCAS